MFRNQNYGPGTYGDYYFLESWPNNAVPERLTAVTKYTNGKPPILTYLQ